MEPDNRHTENHIAPEQTMSEHRVTKSLPKSETFDEIQKATAWVMIGSAMAFAIIGIMAIWEVFGPNTGDIVWRAFSSLAIIAFASLVINVSARMIEDRRR